jgi:ABC-type Mn2+/Zn2+ transport system permease subunit/Mn-dependent DtxR family transcriptional regulator
MLRICTYFILFLIVGLLTYVFSTPSAYVTLLSFAQKTVRFASLKDPSIRLALLGCCLLGVNCGIWSVVVVSRRLALIGDTLSHVVLPGLVISFLLFHQKSNLILFLGAIVAALIGMCLVTALQKTTTIKNDSILAIVLSGFYALGICFLTFMQQLNISGKGGLDKFLFGQASAVSSVDIQLLTLTTIASIVFIGFFYKEILITGFDLGFATAIGIPAHLLNYIILSFVAISVIVSLQSVGIVLVTALLVIPAATAYLLAERMHMIFITSILFSFTACCLGLFFSFLGDHLPTGPFIVTTSSSLFFLALLVSPKYGVIHMLLRQYKRNRRIENENLLKAIYSFFEKNDFCKQTIPITKLTNNEKIAYACLKRLLNQKLVEKEIVHSKTFIRFTQKGLEMAQHIVRKHRLWELYLTHHADYDSTQVHIDAERIEHVLSDEMVQKLTQALDFPKMDPHGRPIPSLK